MVSGDFDWSRDAGAPRPADDHFHVLRATDPRRLVLVPGSHPVLGTSWVDVTPRADAVPLVHYLVILAANPCEQVSLD